MTSDPLSEALKRGLHFHKLSELDQAVTWYRAAIAIGPEDGQANSLLGLALAHAGRPRGDLISLRAVELEPGQVPFRFNLVQGLQMTRAYDRAMAELRVILTREPANFLAWGLAGDIARAQEDPDGARAAWNRARQADPTATAPVLKLARLEIERSHFDAALALLDPIATAAAENEQVYDLWCQAQPGLEDRRRCRRLQRPGSGAPRIGRCPALFERAEFELAQRVRPTGD